MNRHIIALLLLCSACASTGTLTGRAPGDCASPPPADERADLAPSVLATAGSFNLIQVVTYPLLDTGQLWTIRSRVHLRAADSAERVQSQVRTFGHSPRRDLRLVGTWDEPEGAHRGQPIEVDDGVLYLGCRDCLDGSPDVLEITAVGADGFTGTWYNPQTGIGVLIHPSTGEPVPGRAPSGYFCARRTAMPS